MQCKLSPVETREEHYDLIQVKTIVSPSNCCESSVHYLLYQPPDAATISSDIGTLLTT